MTEEFLKDGFNSKGLGVKNNQTFYKCPRCSEEMQEIIPKIEGYCWTIWNRFWFVFDGEQWVQKSRATGGFVFR